MTLGKIVIFFIVFLTLCQVDRHRAKSMARRSAAAICRRFLKWTSPRYAPRTGPCIVFAPHQDDETLGCGGLIARKRNDGLPVHVVFITDGSASHPNHPRIGRAELKAIRHREACEALGILGVESVAIHFLDEEDGALNHLESGREARLIGQIATLLERIGPAEIFLPCNPDGSSEHDAAFDDIICALERTALTPDIWEYPVWSWWNPLLLLKRLGAHQDRCAQACEDFGMLKERALERYESQLAPTPPWTAPTLPPDLLRLLRSDTEFFFRFNLPPHAVGPHPVI